ncbi:hypothetical protein PQX77_003372 [Marasmius sp. AFHP31]|nr:hypothetical protein PQX77_003372 [Marasmius sp. AFHP31]
MNFKLAISLVALAVGVAQAQTQEDIIIDFNDYPWQAPGPNDLRSPCPGLNTLANHGLLPRDGRNITVANIVDAGLKGYNIRSDILIRASKVGFMSSWEPDVMSLKDIQLHGNIEHDASISREDFALGDHIHFNETLFSVMLESNPGSDVYNATSAGFVQHARLADSLARNPNVTNTNLQFFARSTESAFYLGLLGDIIKGEAPKEFVHVFFREERLPIAEGWKRTETPITAQRAFDLAAKIQEASDYPGVTGQDCPAVTLTPNPDTEPKA